MKGSLESNYRQVSAEFSITLCQSTYNFNTLIKFDAIKIKIMVNIIRPQLTISLASMTSVIDASDNHFTISLHL